MRGVVDPLVAGVDSNAYTVRYISTHKPSLMLGDGELSILAVPRNPEVAVDEMFAAWNAGVQCSRHAFPGTDRNWEYSLGSN